MSSLRKLGTIASLAFLAAGNAVASPVKLGCFTERVLQTPGVPPVWLVNFDEEAKTAGLFVKDLGGILHGTDVDITSDIIMFEFTTADGKKGSAFIARTTGTLMVSVEGAFDKILAKCRKQTNAF